MKEITVSDITLREEGKSYTLSFKEKIEIAKILDKLNVDVIETPPITKGKTDVLYLHSIAPLLKNSILSCPVLLDTESVEQTYNAIKATKKPRLHVMVPVSTVQMEFMCHKKPKAMLETINEIVSKAVSLTDDVEVSLTDATRAEKEFLYSAIDAAVKCGAKTVTICDSAGEMLPNEFETFLNDVYENVPSLKDITVSVECSDALHMASACAVSCINAGVTQIKTSVIEGSCPSLASVCKILRDKSDALGISSRINTTVLDNSVNKIRMMTSHAALNTPFDFGTNADVGEEVSLSQNDDITTLGNALTKLGYELSGDDVSRVYDEFAKISKSKKVGAKELDAIVASVAMQVAPTYKLKSYVINNGNIITPTAHIELEKNGEVYQGFCIGDGPIDAAFLAIESITGHHFELDDFQIQAVTEGREAMGSSVVKLRNNGKPYSGKGISTDIIGASINAYINALNKICFEEE